MTQADDILSRVRDIVRDANPNKALPEDNADLFALGILDSFAILEMIAGLETAFEVSLPNEELTLQNFQSLSAIAGLIRRHKG